MSEQIAFSGVVSLEGLSAVLLWADEKQDLLGEPAELVFRQPDWERLAQEHWDTLKDADGAVGECYGVSATHELNDETTFHSIKNHPEIRIAETLCWRGAYNQAYVIYVVGPLFDDFRAVRRATLAQSVAGAIWGDSTVIETFNKGMGYGGCFTAETYEFDGFYYELTRVVEDNECDHRIAPKVTFVRPIAEN